MQIPNTGMNKQLLLATMEGYRRRDLNWRSGRTFAYVYDAGREAEEVGKQAYMRFLSENGLDPTVFPSLLRFENEIVAMLTRHLGGGPECVGSFTSGGTESIILAVKSAREHARAKHAHFASGERRPQMILPATAHAAFHKAAHYLGVDKVIVPVDPVTFKADVAAMAAAITEDTVLLVGSSPSYAHGVIDPIEELGALALEHDLLLHVDACVGGFLLPYWRRLGVDLPRFDLSVPGVTSLSVDLHKYAFCPKGASLVLYNDKALRKHQIFACAEWTGYTVINPTVQSSKSGGPLAAAWAVIHYLGDEGYLEIARQTLEGTRALVAAIEEIDGLELMSQPQMCMLAISSKEVSVFHVVDEMTARGWYLQAQLGFDNSPANIHISLHPGNIHKVAAMIEDLRDAVAAARALSGEDMVAGVQGMFANLDPSLLSDDMVRDMLSMVGVQGVALPERMASINELLDTLEPSTKEALLTSYINDLFQPTAAG